jgi:hypothetical protein
MLLRHYCKLSASFPQHAATEPIRIDDNFGPMQEQPIEIGVFLESRAKALIICRGSVFAISRRYRCANNFQILESFKFLPFAHLMSFALGAKTGIQTSKYPSLE